MNWNNLPCYTIGIFLALTSHVFCKERVVFADEKLSIELPDGWKKSELNSKSTLAGWESPDQTTSAFFSRFNAGNDTMEAIMDSVIDSYEETKVLTVRKVDDYKSGTVKGVGNKKFPAIYTVADITVTAQPRDFELKYYLFVIDTGSAQYFMQASTTKPVRPAREKQILSMVKSLIARK